MKIEYINKNTPKLNIKEIENVYIHLASDDPDEKKKTFKNVFESDLDLI